MKISCSLEDFLSILEEYRNRGVERVYLELDDELEGLRIVPILPNPDIHPMTVGNGN